MQVKRRWLTLQTHHFESLKHSWAPTRRKRMKDDCARTWSCFDQRNDHHVQRLGATLTDRRSPLHLSKLHAAHGYSERLCSLGMLDEASRKIWVSSLRPHYGSFVFRGSRCIAHALCHTPCELGPWEDKVSTIEQSKCQERRLRELFSVDLNKKER